MYGGAALNATHALTWAARRAPRPRRAPARAAPRAGSSGRRDEELASWSELTPGADVLREARASADRPRAAEEFYLRTWAEPAVDVNGILGG